MEMHFATVWEAVADTIPDRAAIVSGARRISWRDYDDRSARLATAFQRAGLGPDSKIGLYLYNSPEYLEAQFAGFKMRAVPVNVNYRYLDDELVYLLDNSDAEALVFHRSLSDRVARILPRLDKLRVIIEVDDGGEPLDGALAYESVVAGNPPMARITRDEADVYILYTGGTTGMPKGVMYAMGSITTAFAARACPLMGAGSPAGVDDLVALVGRLAADDALMVSLPTCPLMHGTGMWLGSIVPMLVGGTVVLLEGRSMDSDEILGAVEAERVSNLVLVGDAMCKPLLRGIDAAIAAGRPYDLSSLRFVVSSGVMWTAEVKHDLIERVPQAVLLDAVGSTEGSMGVQVTAKGLSNQTATFTSSPETRVFTEDGRRVVPGSGEAGMVAAGGNVPLGYYKDETKSAKTFRIIDGVRYAFAGDWAIVNDDGSITLLGRGSQCINTGGEKVFPEEVEEAVKRVAGVEDCLVVGLPDERFGESVAAIVACEGEVALEPQAVIDGVKTQLAGYKAPRHVVFVPTIPRAPNGKADYKAARDLATAAIDAG